MGHAAQGRDQPPAVLDATAAAAVAETLQALVAPSRLLILSHLRRSPATVSELAERVGMERSAVSHQLRLLRMMGMVTVTRVGRTARYELFDQHVAALLDEAVYHAEHVRLGAVDRVPEIG